LLGQCSQLFAIQIASTLDGCASGAGTVLEGSQNDSDSDFDDSLGE